ncbi:MAG: flagellin lysine-N-methylase [Terracidiphilus sp.]
MRRAKIIRPQYIGEFRCVAGECEDSCCVGWAVSIDKDTYKKYQKIPAGPLRRLIDENVLLTPRNADGSEPAQFASMRMPPSKKCPMHNAENLCQIQVEYGESYLSRVCSTFPRASFTIDNLKETTLSLSCPEAARIVLTHPDLLGEGSAEPAFIAWDDRPGAQTTPVNYLWPLREFTVTLLRNRNYALWQRLFLLGLFCRRLETVIGEGPKGNFSALESGFTQAIATGTLSASIDTIQANNALQLDLVLGLAKRKVDGGKLSPRLTESWNVFLEGIGGESLPFEKQCEAYAAAYTNFYAPFFLEHPFMLENFLLNKALLALFPFGPDVFSKQGAFEPARQYALLVTEFALIKGLLIGVAGCRKQAFSVADVVQTVQVVVKHFEHDHGFVSVCLETLAAKGLDNAHGLTMLLRN